MAATLHMLYGEAVIESEARTTSVPTVIVLTTRHAVCIIYGLYPILL